MGFLLAITGDVESLRVREASSMNDSIRVSEPRGGRFGRAMAVRVALRSPCCVLLGLWLAWHAVSAAAETPSHDAMQSLDEQVQEIKSDVLEIGAELANLEERLLFPSNSQVVVFVSLEEEEGFVPDSIRLSIDGALVSHHVYSWKEVEALRAGGVQRLHTANVRTGDHRLEVSIAGEAEGGRKVEASTRFEFGKEVEPALIGVVVSSRRAGEASLAIEEW